MSKSGRRVLQFSDLDEIVAEAQRLQEHGYTKLGNWSLGQCCDHLAKAMELTTNHYSFRLPPPISTFNRALYFGTRWAPELIGKLRLPAPPGLGESQPVDDGEGIARLVKSVGHVKAARDEELQPHPVLGRLTKPQWLRFHLFHSQRHLGFLIPSGDAENEPRSADATSHESSVTPAQST